MSSSRALRAAARTLTVSALLVAVSAAPAEAIIGGQPTPGSPAVVAIGIRDGGSWPGMCSGVMWRPRLILTAAHCVTREGTSAAVDGVAVFPPGATAAIYSNIGPQGASPIQAVSIFRPANYANSTSQVEPNDIAVVQLASDLAPTPFTRLATRVELERWADQNGIVDHVGYGLIGPDQSTQVPYSIALPLVTFRETPLGLTVGTAQSATQGLCPGDSGSPLSHAESNAYYIAGVAAGANSGCVTSAGPPLNVATVPIGYLDVLNPALAAAGYPTIPSAPDSISQRVVKRRVDVRWQAPLTSAETVVAYDVLDDTGVIVCQTVGTSCSVTGLADGTYRFAVRARNAEGEGDAAWSDDTSTIGGLPRMDAPVIRRSGGRVQIVFTTLARDSSFTVSRYVVRDTKGTVLCSGLSGTRPDSKAVCAAPKAPGTYRFVVFAQTSQGRTPVSPPSKRVTIR